VPLKFDSFSEGVLTAPDARGNWAVGLFLAVEKGNSGLQWGAPWW